MINEHTITTARDFFLDLLGLQDVTVDIVYNDTMAENGRCFQVNETEYMIELKGNRNNITEYVLTLAHEMVHVMQYCLGKEMDFVSPYHNRWQEVEAFAKETELLLKFVEFIKR